ncbi:probable serine/threonine-protein phosphatase 2a regulatory subunit b'' subunit ton2 [Phtheirospermum japonicum]|uniref:Probable serine/threonine-protein phosphatase 2a regulatory subunit b'' subunit ton2 n=1 Tax=Phtheirospermum japonicum TaxID=374723 RepID=A0A830C6I2_9LAMI|nr:probable serine/threonine-protein phosphatase 2a regulatory subunit b'' subunit ton2 [Phtheirospermum japonicum]
METQAWPDKTSKWRDQNSWSARALAVKVSGRVLSPISGGNEDYLKEEASEDQKMELQKVPELTESGRKYIHRIYCVAAWIMLWWFHSRYGCAFHFWVKNVSAITSHVDSTLPPPDHISSTIQQENGSSGVFVMVVSSRSPKVLWRIVGLKGTLQVERGSKDGKHGYTVILFTANGQSKSWFYPFSGVTDELKTFLSDISLASLKNDGSHEFEPRLSFVEGARDVAVLDAMLESRKKQVKQQKSAEAGTIPSFYKKKPEEGSISHRVQRLAKYRFLKKQSDLLLNVDDLDAMWVCLRENCVIDDATGAEKEHPADAFLIVRLLRTAPYRTPQQGVLKSCFCTSVMGDLGLIQGQSC